MNKMPQCCSVPLCLSKNLGHRFPRDKELRRKWLTAIKKENYRLAGNSYVCKRHFLPSDYIEYQDTADRPRKRLKRDAIPSQFDWPKGTSSLELGGLSANNSPETSPESMAGLSKEAPGTRQGIKSCVQCHRQIEYNNIHTLIEEPLTNTRPPEIKQIDNLPQYMPIPPLQMHPSPDFSMPKIFYKLALIPTLMPFCSIFTAIADNNAQNPPNPSPPIQGIKKLTRASSLPDSTIVKKPKLVYNPQNPVHLPPTTIPDIKNLTRASSLPDTHIVKNVNTAPTNCDPIKRRRSCIKNSIFKPLMTDRKIIINTSPDSPIVNRKIKTQKRNKAITTMKVPCNTSSLKSTNIVKTNPSLNSIYRNDSPSFYNTCIVEDNNLTMNREDFVKLPSLANISVVKGSEADKFKVMCVGPMTESLTNCDDVKKTRKPMRPARGRTRLKESPYFRKHLQDNTNDHEYMELQLDPADWFPPDYEPKGPKTETERYPSLGSPPNSNHIQYLPDKSPTCANGYKTQFLPHKTNSDWSYENQVIPDDIKPYGCKHKDQINRVNHSTEKLGWRYGQDTCDFQTSPNMYKEQISTKDFSEETNIDRDYGSQDSADKLKFCKDGNKTQINLIETEEKWHNEDMDLSSYVGRNKVQFDMETQGLDLNYNNVEIKPMNRTEDYQNFYHSNDGQIYLKSSPKTDENFNIIDN